MTSIIGSESSYLKAKDGLKKNYMFNQVVSNIDLNLEPDTPQLPVLLNKNKGRDYESF
jgi:hypothetical protein